MIKVRCYGQEHKFKTKKEAYNFFADCYYSCDAQSSEAQRYAKICFEILQGKRNITDGE